MPKTYKELFFEHKKLMNLRHNLNPAFMSKGEVSMNSWNIFNEAVVNEHVFEKQIFYSQEEVDKIKESLLNSCCIRRIKMSKSSIILEPCNQCESCKRINFIFNNFKRSD